MITVDAFRRCVFEAPDLSILSMFASDVSSVRTELFCLAPQERDFLDDDGDSPPADVPLTSIAPPKPQWQPVSRTSAMAAGTASAAPAGVPASTRSTVVSIVPTPSIDEPPRKAQQKSPSLSAGAPPSNDGFVFGDFGTLGEGGGGGGASQRRLSRGTALSSTEVEAGENQNFFGDFAYFVPAPKVEAPANKLELSFNQAMMRRGSVKHHKVLDELDEASDENDREEKADSFSFSDFSLSSDSTLDVSPASRGVQPMGDDAFMFGDFMVEMPASERGGSKKALVTKPAPASTLAPKPPSVPPGTKSTVSSVGPFTSPHRHVAPRTIKRPLVVHGALIREVRVQSIFGHQERVRGAVFASATENCVVSTGGDQCPQLRPLQSTGASLSMYFGHQDMVMHVAIASDLTYIATSGSDGILCIFEVATSKRLGDCTHAGPVLCSSFSKNGKYVVSGAQDGICRLWASKKKNQATPMSSYFGHRSLITCIAFQPNGELVASGSSDAQVHVWSASTGKGQHVLAKPHTHTVMNVQFNNDGSKLLSCDIAKVAFTDVASGFLLATLDVDALRARPLLNAKAKLMITTAAFAPQEGFPNYFFVAATDKSVALYEFIVKGAAASPGPPQIPKKGEKSAPPDITVTLSPEIWSWDTRHRVAWLSTGPKSSMLVGDLGGNLSVVTLVPRQSREPDRPKATVPQKNARK